MEEFFAPFPRISQLFMSTGSPKLARRAQAIEAARRRLRRLEVEAHRIKADLARLEADYEDDVADWLSRKLRRRMPPSAVAGTVTPKLLRTSKCSSGDNATPSPVETFPSALDVAAAILDKVSIGTANHSPPPEVVSKIVASECATPHRSLPTYRFRTDRRIQSSRRSMARIAYQ